MSENSKIEWTDHTWNPWRGCTKVSPGCANCYAETLSKRNPAVLGQWGKGKPRVRAKNWNDPVKWNRRVKWPFVCTICGGGFKPYSDQKLDGPQFCPVCNNDQNDEIGRTVVRQHRPRVFPSLCDWLDDEAPIEWLLDFLKLIHDTPHLDWLLLSKRPQMFSRIVAIQEHLRTLYVESEGESGGYTPDGLKFYSWLTRFVTEGVPNVWHGTSVEDQQRANERIPELLRIPAQVRFLSLEPLLGPVDLTFFSAIRRRVKPMFDALAPGAIDWLIIGGESGPGARPCNVEWIRDLVRQGQDAGVPVFVKQLGANPMGNAAPQYGGVQIGAFITHPKGGDPSEWPADIRVREFPDVT